MARTVTVDAGQTLTVKAGQDTVEVTVRTGTMVVTVSGLLRNKVECTPVGRERMTGECVKNGVAYTLTDTRR